MLLRAGPLTAVLENGDLRYIRFGEHELLRRVYVAVRDHNWGTVPAQLGDLRIEARADSFDVSFEARHVDGAIDFVWHGTISGRPDGTIGYTMDGQARSTFFKNRIGLCVLHPMACAGVACHVRHGDGSLEHGAFPRFIAPHQPFRDIASIAHAPAPGVEVELRLDGDVFEMEDQRNWTDASFKTYSTPLELPYPVRIAAGAAVRQALTIELRDATGAPLAAVGPAANKASPVTLTLLEQAGALPAIGLCLDADRLPAGSVLERLRALNPQHLRLDLDLSADGAAERLRAAGACGLPLLVALFVGDEPAAELGRLRDQLAGARLRIAGWLVFHRRHKVTPADTIRLAREVLGSIAPGAPLGGGTDAYFAQLNREHPASELLDRVCFSINPQVHAFDDASLVENLAAQAATVESARQFIEGRQLAIGPVTLRPRFNPDATGPQPAPAPGALPPEVDARQATLFGAAWTAGSLKYLAEAGVASVTYYAVSGWRGVMERDDGPAAAAFPSRPGMLFPLYHVLADAGEYAGATVVVSRSSDPLAVDGLVLRDGRRQRILLANMSDAERDVVIGRLGGDAVDVRLLDQACFEQATLDGAAFRARGGEHRPLAGGALRLRLPPFAVATIDGAA